jgi:PiT family inorganic phosphate transporter
MEPDMTTATVFDSRIAAGHGSSAAMAAVIALLLGIGIVYAGIELYDDLVSAPLKSVLPHILLGVALLIALGFEFVNGFHDTANAVATVIYTHSLEPRLAVVWSGLFNFLGVLTSTGAVAFGIISLLPVELILQVGSEAGFAMVFALLIAAIIWNLGTWYFGIPNSSSHASIGSIIGVGVMNQIMAQSGSGTSGVDWGQALGVGKSLLSSPLIGFILAAVLLLLSKLLIRIPALYKAPGQAEAVSERHESLILTAGRSC